MVVSHILPYSRIIKDTKISALEGVWKMCRSYWDRKSAHTLMLVDALVMM